MPVRIGFVGCGGIAGTHFNTLSQIDDARPVAFCDVDGTKAEAAARRFKGKAYKDVTKMLEAETLDAIYICLPPFAHKDAEVLCARKGCALFIEKPLARELKTAERMATAIQDAKVMATVGYHFRYLEATERAQKMLTGRGAPTIAIAHAYWMGGFPTVPWWRKMNQSGGQLVEQATHVIDLARYLVGEVKSVYCVAASREMHKVYEGTTVPDASALTLQFENGAIGYAGTTSVLGSARDVGLTLMARDSIYELRENTLTVKQGEQGTHTYQHYNNPYLDEDIAFIKAVKLGRRTGIRSTYADALKTLRVTLAANQSAKTGKPVKP